METGPRPQPMGVVFQRMAKADDRVLSVQRVSKVNLTYPLIGRDTAKSGIGCQANRHLHDRVECIVANVGGLLAEVSSPPVKPASVGAAIVLGTRESRVQGEGRQGIDVRGRYESQISW
jgi:hypothetical protein